MSFRSFRHPTRVAFRPSSRTFALGIFLLTTVGVGAVWGQSAPASPPVTAGWQNGFFVQSANGDNRLTLGTVVQLDGRFTTDDPPAIVDTFNIRKARLVLGGRVARYFDFRIVPDFGNGQTNLLDAYFDVRFSPAFRIRAGKDKTPVGYEVLISDGALLFPERALPSSLLPNRDVGIQAQGDLAAGRVSYSAGVFNGVVDGTSSTADVDTNAGKDLAGRVLVVPFRGAAGPLNGLGFHAGASIGDQTGALPSFRTSVGQTYFSYRGAGAGVPAASADGRRTRVTPAVFYYYKSFGAFGEYVRTTERVARAGTREALTHQGWDVTTSLLLTGEAASPSIPTPHAPFDPPTGRWGGLQVVARYAELRMDDDAFRNAMTSDTASRRATQFTVGANWYPTSFVKYYLTYERTRFDTPAPAARPVEHVIFFRVQLAF